MNVSKALDADVPSKPDGGDEEFTFSPDGAHVVFSARVAGREEAWSTNFDLYEVAVERQRRAEEPHRRQSGLGHAAGVPAQWRPRVARDEPSRIRSRPLPHQAACMTARCATSPRNGTARLQHLDVARDGRTLLATASDLGQTPLFAMDVGERRVTPPLGRRVRRRLLAGAARHGRAVARPRLASRSLSTARQGRAAPAHERQRRARSPRARSASSSSSASRAGTTRRCTATW